MNTCISFKLKGFEFFELADTLSQLESFPPALLNLASIPLSHLEAALKQDGQMTPMQLLAGAYFGFLPLPGTYHKLYAIAERINRLRHDKDEAIRLVGDNNAQARESEAARELGLADRRSIKHLYHKLDELAETHGFESFEAIANWTKTVATCEVISSLEEQKAFATGPLFLFDFAKKAREARLANIVFSSHDGWILIAHRGDGVANLHAINPVKLWRKGFTKHGVLKVSLAAFKDLPPVMPDAVYEALLQLGNEHFQTCEQNIVLQQSSDCTELDLGG
jgi:hypothetical protein